MREIRTRRTAVRTLLILGFIVFACSALLLSYRPLVASAVSNITLTSSGLIKQDSLTHSPDSYWTFNGDAKAIGGKAEGFFNSSGLFVGAETPSANVYAGWFACACAQASSIRLIHATITMDYTSSKNNFNTGLYVQSGNGLINYIFCGAAADSTGYTWDVVEAFGNTQQATSFKTLYSASGGPLVRECTIITNGRNYLKVYIDSKLVFSSTRMKQKMATPFQSYLEVETSTAGQMWWGKYNNYYATTGESVMVTHVPASSVVEILNSANTVLVSQKSGSGCRASCNVNLELAQFSLPLSDAKIEVLKSGSVTASSGPITIWAGDTYNVG